MLKGYKTWIGIVVTILGTIGISDKLGAEQVSGIADAIIQIIGLVITAYGNYKAHQK